MFGRGWLIIISKGLVGLMFDFEVFWWCFGLVSVLDIVLCCILCDD